MLSSFFSSNASDEYISNEVELLNPDSQDRQYLRVFSGSILREMFLPYSVKICFIKIHLHNNSDLDILIECSPYIAAKKHIIKMVENQVIDCYSGKQIPCEIDSVCIHGDGVSALNTAKIIKLELINNKLELKALNKMRKFN